MRPMTRGAALGAAFIIAVATAAQLLAWWLVLDKDIFGPGGDGTKLIADVFGKKVSPALVALRLEYAVRAGILLAVGVLAFGLSQADSLRGYGRRAYSRSYARDDEDEDE